MCTVIFAEDYSVSSWWMFCGTHFEEWWFVVTLHASWFIPLQQIWLFAKTWCVTIKVAAEWQRGGVKITEPCSLAVLSETLGAWMAPLPSLHSIFPPRTGSRALGTNRTACVVNQAQWFRVVLRLLSEFKARPHMRIKRSASEIERSVCMERCSRWIQMHQFFRIRGESKGNYIQGDTAAARSWTTSIVQGCSFEASGPARQRARCDRWDYSSFSSASGVYKSVPRKIKRCTRRWWEWPAENAVLEGKSLWRA